MQSSSKNRSPLERVMLFSTRYIPLTAIGLCILYFVWAALFLPMRENVWEHLLLAAMGSWLNFMLWFMFNRL